MSALPSSEAGGKSGSGQVNVNPSFGPKCRMRRSPVVTANGSLKVSPLGDSSFSAQQKTWMLLIEMRPSLLSTNENTDELCQAGGSCGVTFIDGKSDSVALAKPRNAPIPMNTLQTSRIITEARGNLLPNPLGLSRARTRHASPHPQASQRTCPTRFQDAESSPVEFS